MACGIAYQLREDDGFIRKLIEKCYNKLFLITILRRSVFAYKDPSMGGAEVVGICSDLRGQGPEGDELLGYDVETRYSLYNYVVLLRVYQYNKRGLLTAFRGAAPVLTNGAQAGVVDGVEVLGH